MKDNIAEVGELTEVGQNFCPYAAVARFPYKYIDKAHLQPVSEVYFADGQFRARGWTLYYIHIHLDASSKPIILVPAREVEALLYDINTGFGTSYKMPHSTREPGFLLNFDEKGSPRPRYLGRVNADISVEDMESKIPAPGYKAKGETETEDRSFAAFKAKMEAAVQAGKNKTKSQKEKKKKERIVLKQSWCAQLKRAQCYLGVRPRRGSVAKNDPLSNGTLSWAEYQEAQKAYDIARSADLPELDVTKSVPYLFDKNVVFVCVDIEAWEKDHSVITEIGVSTLDTNDLARLPPGEGGKNWMSAIRPRHFRISEYKHLLNQDFVAGCPDRFEKEFGTSSFISIKEAPRIIASCFREPFSASYKMKTHENLASDSLFEALNQPDPQAKRNIILVGHEIRSDIDYLKQIGYDVSNLPNLLEAIDTAVMFKALRHEQQSRSLGGVLLELEMVGWNLHNAGNDAAYTLQAMIGVAFAGLQDKQRSQAIAEAERARRIENAAQDAEDRIVEETEEWEAADVDGDGGVPLPLSKSEDESSSGPKGKGGPRMNHAARAALQKTDTRRAASKAETFASASGGGGRSGGNRWQGNGLINSDEHPSTTSKGLFIHNVSTQDDVLNLFPPGDEQNIVSVEHVGKLKWSVHFKTHEEAKTAFERQPEDRKKPSLPGQPRKTNIKWFNESRGTKALSTSSRDGQGKASNYKPVTEWGPPSVSSSSKGQPNGKANKAALTVKDLSQRMKSRMGLLGSGDEGEGGVDLLL